MGTNLYQEADFLTRKSTPFAYVLSDLFLLPQRKNILFLLYGYFRWADDMVDGNMLSKSQSQSFIKEQIEIVTAWYDGVYKPASTKFEHMAWIAIMRDIENGGLLRNMVLGFLNALSWDSQRRYEVVNQAQLDNYSFLLGNSYSEGLLYGLGLNPNDATYDSPKRLCGIAAHRAHILRDFTDDIRLGYFNISSEDLAAFSIDFKNLQSTMKWRLIKANDTHGMFLDGLKFRYLMPTLRARIIFELFCQKYVLTLAKVERHAKQNILDWNIGALKYT